MVFNMNTLLKIKTYSLYTIMFMSIPFIVGIVQDNFAMAEWSGMVIIIAALLASVLDIIRYIKLDTV